MIGNALHPPISGRFALLLSAASAVLISTAAAQTPQTAAPAGVDDIVVTAQYREQRLIDVPTSITAVSQEQLRLTGVSNLKDLQYAIPNVTFAGESFAGNPKVVIRGLYINTRTTGLEPSFGVYVDGVFQGRPIAYNLDLPDAERIEYLRGPQGTLYGKNTMSGAVNVITQKPGDTLEGAVEGEYGNYNHHLISGTVRGPITDKLGFRLTAYETRREGFYENVNANANDHGAEDRYGGSALLRFTPDEKLEVLFAIDGMNENRSIYLGEASSVLIGSEAPFSGSGLLPYGNGLASLYQPDVARDPYKINHNSPSGERREIFGTSLTANYRFDGYTLTSISAYRAAEDEWRGDDDYSPFDLSYVIGAEGSFDQFTQEVRLTSPDEERFNYVVGAFLMTSDIYQNRRERTGDGTQVLTGDEEDFLRRTAFGGSLAAYGGPATGATMLDYYNILQRNDRYEQYSTGSSDSYALYGQANFELTEKITLFGGLRYSIEEKWADYVQRVFNNNVAGTTTLFGNGGRAIPYFKTKTYRDEKLTPSLGVQYEPSDTLTLFARYAEGFKGTGFNFGNGIGNTTTQPPDGERGRPGAIALLPEEVESYEAGVKARLFDRRLAASLTYFYQKGHNLQISAFLPDYTRPAFNTDAELQGFELELDGLVADPLRLGLNVGYTHTICVGGGAAGAVSGASRFNATCTEGVDLENVSEWNISSNATYTRPIPGDHELVARLDAFYRTEFLGGSYYVDGYAKFDGRVGVQFANGVSTFLWGKNLTDETTIGNAFGSSNGRGTLTTGSYDFIETFDAPRTYGVSVDYRF